MVNTTTIEWTDKSWNPATGCDKISPGCDNCYAAAIAERFRGSPAFPNGFDLTLHPERLAQPLQMKKPRMIFVNSMSDLFHKDIPEDFISAVFDTMERAHWHIFQVLTKRSSLMRDFLHQRYGNGRGPRHIWCGVSIEDGARASRIQHLRDAPAGIRFLSIEPLIGPIGSIDLSGIDWVIVGGESGPHHRPIQADWVRSVRDQCQHTGVAFFFKQWGGLRPKSGGKVLDGREWCDFPI